MRKAKILGITIALSLAASVFPAAASSFIARPTEPLACPSDATNGALWQGYFHGRKEVDHGFMKYEDAAERPCFRSEKLCRNWLYNMQSEYDHFVWSAVCTRFGG